MKEDVKYILFLLVIIAGFYLLGRFTAPKVNDETKQSIEQIRGEIGDIGNELQNRIITGRKADTAETIVYRSRPEVIYRDTGRIVYLSDSVFSAKPFVAFADSIIGGDTIMANYSYPANMFDLRLKLKTDTLKYKIITLTQYETKIIQRPLWLDVISHTGAAAIGLGIGYAIGR